MKEQYFAYAVCNDAATLLVAFHQQSLDEDAQDTTEQELRPQQAFR